MNSVIINSSGFLAKTGNTTFAIPFSSIRVVIHNLDNYLKIYIDHESFKYYEVRGGGETLDIFNILMKALSSSKSELEGVFEEFELSERDYDNKD